MKISILSHSDTTGGAARAAYRIHQALRSSGLDSRMLVNEANTGDWTVEGPHSRWGKMLTKARPLIIKLLMQSLGQNDSILYSPAIFPTHWASRLNNSDTDIVHMHWINYEMLSIYDIAKINKPLMWTLHDMWAFSGAEHVSNNHRWREGYTRKNRPEQESGFDINRWVWQRKRKAWRRPIHIVTPSKWLADCVRQSDLMRDWPIDVIPNVIDAQVWSPIEKNIARKLLGINSTGPVLLFGAFGSSAVPYKGVDLLYSALQDLHGQVNDLQLVVLGERAPRVSQKLGFPVNYLGHLHDDISLKILYSAVDVTVIPSRQDNFPNIGVESMACGTPVVAFDTCGLPDIVSHRQTGYLAEAFDTEDMAAGLAWILNDSSICEELGKAARKRALEKWTPEVVIPKYLEVYKKIVSSHI